MLVVSCHAPTHGEVFDAIDLILRGVPEVAVLCHETLAIGAAIIATTIANCHHLMSCVSFSSHGRK